jgi:chromosome partitioning protein
MRTIAISINKGGVGKTTVVKHLATAAVSAGLNVLILDMDTQQNVTSWSKRRNRREGVSVQPAVRFITEGELQETLERARVAQCDLVLIDTPPGRSAEAPAAVEASDWVLIPFWLENDAFDGLKKTADMARRLGVPATGILNFATPNSQGHIDAARDVLEKLGVAMSPMVLHRYEAYRLANPPGLTVQEREPGSRAASEVAALWDWVSSEVQLCTAALVQDGAAA